ncbi:tRNA modification GTPase TrmE [Thioalkalivibrio sp. K90mix]|uniref:tRNA uridine-5-carboxymethylaminomethyl(34) synthesis GTPase MnmE n=1 Tax=unclassified Thioalkalivibrio TaxID=2621013 RepID=UPI000195AA0D|nr:MULTISPECIES: tRNA uridine-5-carboxymethylaminomethyl(34) synthesis GTPase MnmE [unclassified Thioalkalivibrio]ADC73088.1 tRNA modification GTPase TrmE [Thioalkalivibrio sp. K90mix]
MTVADTIVAVATPPGVGGIGVVRLSGPQSLVIARRLTGRDRLRPRQAHYGRLTDPASGETIDDGLILYFPAPHSYTGEDVVELQGHGSPVLLEALVAAAVGLGARRARPGEFTEQAFLNGRLDLAQAEAVADLIHAQTTQAARLARSSLDGALAAELEPVSRAIRDMRVIIEAEIDFGETDLESEAAPDIARRTEVLHTTILALLERLRPARYFAQGLRLALVGAPNVGKSSLMNRLAESEVAIVTDRPGTTRDVLRSPIAIHGIPVELIDTAGLHASDDPVEKIGMQRAREAATGADLILDLRDLTRPEAVPELEAPPEIPRLTVWNKQDCVADSRSTEGIVISARTGAGIDELKQAIVERLGASEGGQQRFSVRARHLDGLRLAALHLGRIEASAAPDLIAEELRLAEAALDALLGRQDHEALLGEIFAGFCIGK